MREVRRSGLRTGGLHRELHTELHAELHTELHSSLGSATAPESGLSYQSEKVLCGILPTDC